MRFFLFLLTIAVFSACCKEKACIQSYLSIGTIRFTKAQIDTVVVKRFVPGATTPVDSLLLALEKNSFHHRIGNDTTIIFILEPIDFIKAGFDYKISIPATGHLETISEYTEVQGTWKDCPASSQTPCRTQISYKSNGNLTASETFWITR